MIVNSTKGTANRLQILWCYFFHYYDSISGCVVTTPTQYSVSIVKVSIIIIVHNHNVFIFFLYACECCSTSCTLNYIHQKKTRSQHGNTGIRCYGLIFQQSRAVMLLGGCHNAFMASQVLESDCQFVFVKNNFSTSNN